MPKKLSFSEDTPSITNYEDPSDESTKWYSCDDIEEFKSQEKYETTCIRQKIASCPKKSSKAISILLEKEVLKLEDFLGVDDLTFEEGKSGGKASGWTKLKMKMIMLNCTKSGAGAVSDTKSMAKKRNSLHRRPSVEDCADSIKPDLEFHGIKMELVESILRKLQPDE